MKKSVLIILCFMICFTYISQSHVYAQVDSNISGTEFMIGSGETYANMKSLFDDASVSGDVIAVLKNNISESTTSALEIPDTYTSFTLKSDSNTKREWDIYSAKMLFANGKKVIIEDTVNVKSFVAVTLYGGSETKDVLTSSLNIYGGWTGDIYGGGLNNNIINNVSIDVKGSVIGNVYGGGNSQASSANVGGDVSITVSGEVTTKSSGSIGYVFGGGYVKLKDGFESSADIAGNVHILVEKEGSVEKVIGGGYIQVGSGINGGKATAKVNGKISMNLQGTVKSGLNSPNSVIGGGYIYSILFSGPSASSFAADASVLGDIEIDFGSDFKGSDQLTEVTGGGYVDLSVYPITGTQQAIADVKSVSISATKDSLASSSQNNSQAFGEFRGGGYAKGSGAQANVLGSTNIEIARACWNSPSGLIGGGTAASGGTANVNGTAKLTVISIENQISSYENMNGIFGGGYTSDNTVSSSKQSTANVKNTSIHIMPNAKLVSGNTQTINIVGGGYAKGSKSCSAIASVLNDVDIIIEKNVKIDNRVFGGGYAEDNGDTPIGGNISFITKENCYFKKEFYGGSNGGCWDTQDISDITIGGNIYVELGSNNTIGSHFYGGSQAYYCSFGNVMGDVTLKIGNDCEIKGDFVSGGTATYGNTKANVLGKVTTTLYNNVKLGSKLTIGGLNNEAKANQASLTLLGNSIQSFYIDRGYVINNADVIVGQNQVIQCDIGYLNGIDNFVINKNAVVLQKDKSYGLFFDVKNLEIKEDGTLRLLNSSITKETIKGNFISYGTLELLSSLQLIIEGKSSGDTQLIINGTLIKDNVYIKTKYDDNANFTFSKDGLKIKKVIGVDEVLWQLLENNQATITTNQLSNGVIGTQYSQQLETDSQDSVTWSISGNLPNGLILDSNTGIISGIPTKIGIFSFDVIADNGSLDKDQKRLSIEIKDISSIVTVELYKNNVIWNNHNKLIKLVNDNNVISDLTSVPNGEYKIYIGEEYVNQKVTVDGQNKTVRIDYYSVDVSLETMGSITNKKINITANNKQIENHAILLKNTSVSISIDVAGADNYEYLWSNKETNSSIHIPKMIEQLNLICIITGYKNPTAETNDLTGIKTGDIYIHGEEGRFEAIGSGMDNLNPIKGDIRWLPERWKVNPSGSFKPNGPFEAVFDTSVMKVGKHVLYVYFTKQMFDGTKWIDLQEECEKTVSFTIESESKLPDITIPIQPSLPNQNQSNREENAEVKTNDTYNLIVPFLGMIMTITCFILFRKKTN